MLKNNRTTVSEKSTDYLEYNLEKVVNLTSQKLRELLNRKQEKIRESGRLKAQRSVLESEIIYYEKEIKEKENEIKRLAEECTQTELEINELTKDFDQNTKICNNQKEIFKNTFVTSDREIDEMTLANLIIDSEKNSDVKLEYENYVKIRKENKEFEESLQNLRKEFYYLEVNIN